MIPFKKIILFFFLAGTCQFATAQNYMSEFQKLSGEKDTAAQAQLLKEWEEKNPGDAELYVAFFNFYINKSTTDFLSIDQKPSGKQSLELTDSTNETAGYINGVTSYEKESLNKAFEYIDKGIAKFPDRLDMRFGKIYMLGQDGRYDAFTDEVVKTIAYSATNRNKWTWSDNEPVKDPERFLLLSIQDYFVELYDVSDEQADNMKKIAESVLKLYPDHVESLSNLSISYAIKGEYDNALIPLLKAEKLAPEDYIILNNIALCYSRKGDTKNAIKYYELTAKYGDEEARESANKKLTELKKQ